MRHVRAGYGDIEVLKDISLTVQHGQIATIIGPNGAGKSTLLKTIFGLVQPADGQIYCEGEAIETLAPIEKLKRGIAFVPAGRANFPAMTVQENLEMGAYIRRDQRAVRQEIDRLCAQFPILQEKRHVPIGNLSGGQQQMVEIAMAMVLRPRLMLIDEPTIGLAPMIVEDVFKVIQDINARGTTIILVEQNARRALEISDFGFVLELGYIRYSAPADQLAGFQEVYRAYFGER